MSCIAPSRPRASPLRDAVAEHDPFALTGLHDLVTLSGSLVLGLAVARRALDAAEAWRLRRGSTRNGRPSNGARTTRPSAAAALKRRAFLGADRLLGLLRSANRFLEAGTVVPDAVKLPGLPTAPKRGGASQVLAFFL